MFNLSYILFFLILLKVLTLMVVKRRFLMVLINLELIVINLFFCLVCVLGSDFVFLYLFLALVACESVIGLSVLVNISRNRSLKNRFISNCLN